MDDDDNKCFELINMVGRLWYLAKNLRLERSLDYRKISEEYVEAHLLGVFAFVSSNGVPYNNNKSVHIHSSPRGRGYSFNSDTSNFTR